jgi:hypothetical protein
MSSVASRERERALRPPLAVPDCEACVKRRCHTPEDWKRHPLAGHGHNGIGWTHPAAEAAHAADIKSATARLAELKRAPEAK